MEKIVLVLVIVGLGAGWACTVYPHLVILVSIAWNMCRSGQER